MRFLSAALVLASCLFAVPTEADACGRGFFRGRRGVNVQVFRQPRRQVFIERQRLIDATPAVFVPAGFFAPAPYATAPVAASSGSLGQGLQNFAQQMGEINAGIDAIRQQQAAGVQ